MSTFEVIRGVEGCCLALDDTRIAGPKPWGGGTVIHAWETNEEYKPIVRCSDCKYMFDWAYDRMLCKMWADGGMDDDAKNVLYAFVEPDGYCAWGERRED